MDSLSARACATCHEAEHAQWAASRHAAAFTNALFRASFGRARQSCCVHCHAPLPEQHRPALAPVETATHEPVRHLEFRLAALPGPLPEVLHWRLEYLLAEPELEGLVPPELLRQEAHRGTVALPTHDEAG